MGIVGVLVWLLGLGSLEVQGQLVLPDGEKPADWRVVAASRLFPALPQKASADVRIAVPGADGSFTLTCPEAGWVFVGAYVKGMLDVESLAPVLGRKGSSRVVLKPAPLRSSVEFALLRPDGRPLGSRMKVHLYNLYGEAVPDGLWSDEQGVVRLERLPATRYDLWLEAPPESPWAAALFRNLEVTSGPDLQRIALKVPEAGSVQGRLLLPDGKTLAAGYTVAVQTGTVPEETPPEAWRAVYAQGALTCYAEALVGPDGIFLLRGLAPGRHALDIRRPGERVAWCTLYDVEVREGQTVDLGPVRVAQEGWEHLFDRHTLKGWRESDFWQPGAVRIENDRIVMEMGNDMTGITWTQDLPRVDYELSLQAMRVAGSDFFCGLTFPVKEDPCTLILGGWGGSVVGLSSINGYDASENETSQWIQFENRRWYRVRLRVTQRRIEAWLDEKPIIGLDLEGKRISIRIECEPSRPLGIATWRTVGAVRDLRLRRVEAR